MRTPSGQCGAPAHVRTAEALPHASAEVADLWCATEQVVVGELPPAGLAAGERPSADVEVLASAAAAVEYELARRMNLAHSSGSLPLHGPGAMLAARGWPKGTSRRLARCGAMAAAHPSIAAAWASGRATSEHIDPVARCADRFSDEELAALICELEPHWGSWSPTWISRFVEAADRMLHPRPDPTGDEVDARESRCLSFSLTKDSVLLAGSLPRLEGELVIAAIDALADRLRSTADHVPAAARRADALVGLVNAASSAGALPTRNGLPVALTVTLDRTELGDTVLSTSRGHQLTEAEARWACCDAEVTPVVTTSPGCCDSRRLHPGGPALAGFHSVAHRPAARIAALAALTFDTRIPLAVGRTERTATAAQRRALAVRDRGCVIPGCEIPAEACQAHHLTDWAEGGETDISNLALLCWAHHRQVDLSMWTIEPGRPPGPAPTHGAPPGTPWPANHGAPFTIARTPRQRWRT